MRALKPNPAKIISTYVIEFSVNSGKRLSPAKLLDSSVFLKEGVDYCNDILYEKRTVKNIN